MYKKRILLSYFASNYRYHILEMYLKENLIEIKTKQKQMSLLICKTLTFSAHGSKKELFYSIIHKFFPPNKICKLTYPFWISYNSVMHDVKL